MLIAIIFGLFIILVISFFLALRSLSELEVPKEIIDAIKRGERPPRFWGMIFFLKGKTLHYSSSSSEGSEGSVRSPDLSSNNSSRSSERIDV